MPSDALAALAKQGIVREVTSNRDVCAVAVVGSGMAGAKGTGGRIFTALGKGGYQRDDDLTGIIRSQHLLRRQAGGRTAGSPDTAR